MDAKGLERNDRKGVFHLTLIDGVASRHVEHACWRIRHGHVTTSLHIDITLFVGREFTSQHGAILNAECQVHVDACEGSPWNFIARWWRCTEIHEGDNIFESVCLIEYRFRHDISDVGRWQHAHQATNGQVLGGADDTGEEVTIHVTIEQRPVAWLCFYQFEVTSVERKRHENFVEIGEIHMTIQRERIGVSPIELEVIEVNAAVVENDTIVCQGKVDVIRLGEEVNILWQQSTIEEKATHRSRHLDVASHCPLEAHQLAG